MLSHFSKCFLCMFDLEAYPYGKNKKERKRKKERTGLQTG
jgi:hypothetical protein